LAASFCGLPRSRRAFLRWSARPSHSEDTFRLLGYFVVPRPPFGRALPNTEPYGGSASYRLRPNGSCWGQGCRPISAGRMSRCCRRLGTTISRRNPGHETG
jgi:hypothetical protein